MSSGLPLHGDALFACAALGCRVRARVCIARQVDAAEQRQRDPTRPHELARHDGKRGRTAEFVHCARCAQGVAIREALGDAVAANVRRGLRPPKDLLAWHAGQRGRPWGEIPSIDTPIAER